MEGNHVSFSLYYYGKVLSNKVVNLTLNGGYRLSATTNISGGLGAYAPLNFLGNRLLAYYKGSTSSISLLYLGSYGQLMYIFCGVVAFVVVRKIADLASGDHVIINCAEKVDNIFSSTGEGYNGNRKSASVQEEGKPFSDVGWDYIYGQGISHGRYSIHFTKAAALRANHILFPQSVLFEEHLRYVKHTGTVLFTSCGAELCFLSKSLCYRSPSALLNLLTSGLRVDKCYI